MAAITGKGTAMISLIIPAYNESAVIENTVRASAEALDRLGEEWELLVVDDGSADDTAARAQSAAGGRARVIRYAPNRGKGCAVRTGVLASRGDVVFFTDADLAYGLDVVGAALAVFRETGCDIVAGSRRLDREAYRAYPPMRRLASRCFALGSRLLSGMCWDTQCGFKGFTREAADDVFSRCEEDRFAFDFEVMLTAEKRGYAIAQMPVRIVNHRASSVRLVRDSLRMAKSVLAIRRRLAAAVRGDTP